MDNFMQFPFEEKEFLGNRMRELRLTFGFKQEDVARMLNVSRSTYSYYETGVTRPDPAVLGKLAVLYRVPVEMFFGVEDEPTPELGLRDPAGRRQRSSRSAGLDPMRVGDLLPGERSLILFLRANPKLVAPEELLQELIEVQALDSAAKSDDHVPDLMAGVGRLPKG